MTHAPHLLPPPGRFDAEVQRASDDLRRAYIAGLAAGLADAASYIYMLAHDTNATGREIGYRDRLKTQHDLLLLMAERYAELGKK